MARQPPTISTSARAASRPGRKCLHRDRSTTTPLGWRPGLDDYSCSRPIWSLSAASSSSNDFGAGRVTEPRDLAPRRALRRAVGSRVEVDQLGDEVGPSGRWPPATTAARPRRSSALPGCLLPAPGPPPVSRATLAPRRAQPRRTTFPPGVGGLNGQQRISRRDSREDREPRTCGRAWRTTDSPRPAATPARLGA